MQKLISVQEAETLIQQHMPTSSAETCPLPQARGRVLREEIHADRDIPPYDRVMMDGIALDYGSSMCKCGPFHVEGISPAGAPPVILQDPEKGCIEVMTGSILPMGCDTIIPYEDVDVQDQTATLQPDIIVNEGQFIHNQGSDHTQHDRLLEQGCRLHPPQFAIAASVGLENLKVAYQPSIAVISTGDELIPAGQPVEAWQIHSINTYSIQASIEGEHLGRCHSYHLPDEQAVMHKQLLSILQEHDIVIISGGVSMGKFDLVPGILMDLGVKPVFHKILERPGKPFWFGTSSTGKPVFGLPGNPVSTLMCLHRYILPALLNAAGAHVRTHYAQLSTRIDFDLPLTYFPPVRELTNADGMLAVAPLPYHNSGHFSTLANSDGFIELPAKTNSFLPGTVVRYHRWVNG